jgi:hypothetical protein
MSEKENTKQTALETVQDNVLAMTDFLIHHKRFHIRSLVTRKLNDITYFLILLNGTVTTEILLERLADSLNVQVI